MAEYIIVFTKDLQPTPEKPNLLHSDLINKIIEIPNIEYRGMKIWSDESINLYPYGYPYAFSMNQLHQYILIFRKVIWTPFSYEQLNSHLVEKKR